MNFFEQELHKVIEPENGSMTYVGRCAYVDLGGGTKAKIHFCTSGYANHYDSLGISILNKTEGVVDSIKLNFTDILGVKPINNPNFPEGVEPHIWVYNNVTEWYGYHPSKRDYGVLHENVHNYLSVFQEQSPSIGNCVTPEISY